MENPIFIVGLHRTGSTLWHNLIAMYPEICRLPDPWLLGAWWQKDFRYFLKTQVGDLAVDANVERMVELIFSHEHKRGLDSAFWRFENFEFVRNPEFKKRICSQIKNSDRSLKSIFKILVEEIVCSGGYTRACVKFPVDIGHVPELLAYFPNCSIIHISRDPRAIAISKTNDPGGTAIIIKRHRYIAFFIKRFMLIFAIAQYIRSSKLHFKYKNLENYRLFLYEDLLVDPAKTMKELCEFTGIAFLPEKLQLAKGRHEHQLSSLTGLRKKDFDKEPATRWQSIISPFEKWIITVLTRGSMQRFGYDPKSHPIFGGVSNSPTVSYRPGV